MHYRECNKWYELFREAGKVSKMMDALDVRKIPAGRSKRFLQRNLEAPNRTPRNFETQSPLIGVMWKTVESSASLGIILVTCTKHRSHAFRIPSTIQSPSCHLAECKTPLSSCPASKSYPDMGLRTVLTVQKPKTATPIQVKRVKIHLWYRPRYSDAFKNYKFRHQHSLCFRVQPQKTQKMGLEIIFLFRTDSKGCGSPVVKISLLDFKWTELEFLRQKYAPMTFSLRGRFPKPHVAAYPSSQSNRLVTAVS
ncbi:uncharacterized protein TNCV_4392971 [Trichonephila clavipes]|nr:uncharacterized protein TNCV_4392971 [Trichonephila clavipes]